MYILHWQPIQLAWRLRVVCIYLNLHPWSSRHCNQSQRAQTHLKPPPPLPLVEESFIQETQPEPENIKAPTSVSDINTKVINTIRGLGRNFWPLSYSVTYHLVPILPALDHPLDRKLLSAVIADEWSAIRRVREGVQHAWHTIVL